MYEVGASEFKLMIRYMGRNIAVDAGSWVWADLRGPTG